MWYQQGGEEFGESSLLFVDKVGFENGYSLQCRLEFQAVVEVFGGMVAINEITATFIAIGPCFY